MGPKSVVFAVVLSMIFPVFLLCAEMKEYEISPRTGSVIDQQEREYFRLFPDFYNFVRATFYEDGINRVSVVVEYDNAGKRQSLSIGLNDDIQKSIRVLIENYEYLFKSNTLNSSLGVKFDSALRQCIMPAKRYDEDNSVEYEFTNLQQKKIRCKLLYVDSLRFVVCPVEYQYDWKTAESNCVVYSFSELTEMKSNKDIYMYNLKYLRELSPFLYTSGGTPIPPPPEIARLLRDYANASALDTSGHSGPTPEKHALLNAGANITPLTYFLFGNYETPYALRYVIPSVFVDILLSDNIGIGIACSFHDSKEENLNYMDYDVSGTITAVYLSWIINNRIGYSMSFWDYIDYSTNIGLVIGSSHFNYKGNRDQKFTQATLGLTGSFKADYYLLHNLSVFSEIYLYILLNNEFESEIGNHKITIKPNLSGFGLRFGLGLHL